MKNYKVAYIVIFALCFMWSCKQEIIELQPQPVDSVIVVPGVKGNQPSNEQPTKRNTNRNTKNNL